jgi:tRNA(Ile)-lysidine synthase
MKPRPVEIALHKFLQPFKEKSFLLAVSGGLDSMALLYAFVQMRSKLKLDIRVAYVHHGAGTPEQVQFRNQCYEMIAEICIDRKIPFFPNIQNLKDLPINDDFHSSESTMRKLRLRALAEIKKESESYYVVFAHHQDDLLETRLIRLLRGCGPAGFIAMKPKRGAILRPFLQFTKQELMEYLQIFNGQWVEDPSNLQTSYMRNWLRHTWLPALEEKYPGSLHVLAQSLDLIANSVKKKASLEKCFTKEGKIIRSALLCLDLEQRKQVFAIYLQRQNVKDYGLSHINELVKRLDVEKKDLTFKLAKMDWNANARHIWCVKRNTF